MSDNPVFLPPDRDHPDGRVLSTGGYHNAAAWPALNALAMAYADLCTVCDRMIARLLDGRTSGLPDQLGGGDGDRGYLGTLGFAVVGYGEAARRAAQAVFLPGSDSGGFVQNDLAVPTALAWEGQDTAGRMLDAALGAVAVVASQALHVSGRDAPPALQPTPRRLARRGPAAHHARGTRPAGRRGDRAAAGGDLSRLQAEGPGLTARGLAAQAAAGSPRRPRAASRRRSCRFRRGADAASARATARAGQGIWVRSCRAAIRSCNPSSVGSFVPMLAGFVRAVFGHGRVAGGRCAGGGDGLRPLDPLGEPAQPHRVGELLAAAAQGRELLDGAARPSRSIRPR